MQRQSSIITFLLVTLLVEIVGFGALGTNFYTVNNAADILRLSVDIGLLSLALTPVILTGGIDLSVGSIMGLSATLFGLFVQQQGWPVPAAIALTLVIGLAAGGLNAILITRLRLPPLIVTLGTMSLFRGLAEGITLGSKFYSGFPAWYLSIGQDCFAQQGFLAAIPYSIVLFAAVAVAFWCLVHRTTIGRALVAIGFSPEGAGYAGLPVNRRLTLVYLLSGVISALAGLIYVATWNQARANVGTTFELQAITVVVLGGTSIFGGRGSVHGTLLSLFVITVLRRGLILADFPTEMADIATGVLLLTTISFDMLRSTFTRPARSRQLPKTGEELDMKNSQLALLCGVILASAALIAGSNYWLAKSLRSDPRPSPSDGQLPNNSPMPKKKLTIAVMPKSIGNSYFESCKVGVDQAARELDVDILWNGPKDPDPAEQNKIVDAWVTRGVDVIAVAVEDRSGIASSLRKARAKGIKVITWDSDTDTDARDFFVNQATPEGIAQSLVDNTVKAMGDTGEYAVISASLSAANMVAWQLAIEKYNAEKYPNLKRATILPCDDIRSKATEQATTIMNAHPNVKVIMAICSPAVPGAAEAVERSGRKDVKVVGLSLPNENKKFVHADITKTVILWNTADLGYLTVHAAHQLHSGQLKPGDKSLSAGRLQAIEIAGDNILLGKPFPFTKDNIDKFDF